MVVNSLVKTQVVAALLTDGDQVLVAQRKSTDSGAGFWEFPGGKVEAGESFEQALEREILEELEMPIQVLKLLDSHELLTPTKKVIQLSLFATQVKSKKFVLNDHDDAKWVSWKDLSSVAFLQGNKQFLPAVEAFFKNRKSV